MNASRPFQAQRTYPVSICDTFIQKLDRRLLPSFRCLYFAHATTHCLDATYQRQQLSIILSATQTAEDKVHQVQDIACLLVGQGFFSMAYGGQQISAYLSQAETTLTQYAGGGRKPNKCWGCGKEDHPWHKGKGPIPCPMKDDPACIKRATESIQPLELIEFVVCWNCELININYKSLKTRDKNLKCCVFSHSLVNKV